MADGILGMADMLVQRNGRVFRRGTIAQLGNVLSPSGSWRASCKCGWSSTTVACRRVDAIWDLLGHLNLTTSSATPKEGDHGA